MPFLKLWNADTSTSSAQVTLIFYDFQKETE